MGIRFRSHEEAFHLLCKGQMIGDWENYSDLMWEVSGVHPISYLMATGGSSGRSVKLTTHLQDQENVNLYIHSPRTSSWYSA
jgi:hypothetical protein